MEQGRTEDDMKQQQDHDNRQLKPPVQPENLPHHQQQPQKCPRCDSLNTKFCYYNNYSLSQPRYFCKTCRRYWTQGGTLRNVPVGGGCRKGKRAKASSSSGDISRSQPSAPPPPQEQQSATMIPALRNKELGNLALPPGIPSATSYYSGGGFLSSLAAMPSSSPPQPFNQPPVSIGGQFAQHQLIQQQNEFYQMGNRDKNIEPIFPSDQSLIQPNRPPGSWNQSLMINNSMNPSASNPSFWNSSTNNTTSNSTSGTPLNPNQWPDLPGYGPPT
ncbi:hypothetical protein F0562_018535 [Nyssa sinensis]|uniref:Dof zinc finger protein n=1 Tax=Nyssa sinensis TaxID=561372 RepID=A0A5J4Z9M1_9ASTE|nr:hypothetical protein F0562_018535 [Nyssa sinensis]